MREPTCRACGGSTEPRRVRVVAGNASPPVLVENVPAQVCRQCGERTYSTRTLTTLQRVRDGEVVASHVVPVSVYDFDDIS